jgi:hypothetical protein
MDSVFVKVKEAPSSLSSKEMLVTRLNFLEELKSCKTRKPATDLITLNYLRGLADEIGSRYDKAFNAYRNVVPSDFIGIKCESQEDLSKIIEQMFMSSYPQILDKYVEHQLRKRPLSIRVIYAVGDLGSYEAFARSGIPEITQQQLDDHLGDAKLNKKSETIVVEKPNEESNEAIKETEQSSLRNLFKRK